MLSSELAKAAQAAAVIRQVIRCDFRCSTREAFDGKYGQGAILILFQEGDNVLNWHVNYEYGQYDKIEKLADALHEAGFFVEDCNGSYSAVYELDKEGGE